jgi:hypothetical protein
MGLQPVELEIGRHSTAEFSQPRKKRAQIGLVQIDCALPDYLDVQLIAFLQLERVSDCARNTDGETVSPSSHLHRFDPMIYILRMYIMRSGFASSHPLMSLMMLPAPPC